MLVTKYEACNHLKPSYIRFGTVVTDDLRVLFTEACIKRMLAEVCQQLDPPALSYILTEMHHTVQVVDVGGFGLLVSIFIHCN